MTGPPAEKTAGQVAYEAYYQTGPARAQWHLIGPVAQSAWERAAEAAGGSGEAPEKQRRFLERHGGRMGRVDRALAEARGEAPAGEEIALRRCPKCKKLTMSYECCYVKGPPLFPQMDDYTVTERVHGVFIEAAPAPSSTGGREGRE